MKILHIADFGKSGNLNGVGESVLHIAESQLSFGAEVIIAYTCTNPYIINNSICFLVDSRRRFKLLLNKIKPDIAVFHSFYDFKHPKFALTLKKMHIPYLITFHGGASKANYQRKHLIKVIVNKLIFRPYIKSAAATIYLNKGERSNSIFTKLDSNKSQILPNGILSPNRTNGFKPSDQIVISFISRLDYYGKGIDILLEAINLIEDELLRRNIEFRFYGYDYNDGTVERIVSASSLCKYYGYVLSAEKEKAFLETNIFILTSRSEGMPVSILEALSYGIPCILTPQTNMAEIIEKYKCGWVTELTPHDISIMILKAVDEFKNNYKVLKDNAIKASLDYSWDVIAKKSIAMYEFLIKV